MKTNKFSRCIFTLTRLLITLLTVLFYVIPLYIKCKIACHRNPQKKVYKEFANISKIMLWAFGTKFESFGEIPDGENYIVVCGHQNWMDVFAINSFFSGIAGVAFVDAKMFKYPVVGFFLKRVNAISINHRKERRTLSAFKKSIEVLNSNTHLFIFPEGTRTPDGNLSKIKHGTAELSIRTGKKILVLGLAGLYEFSRKGTKLFTPSKVILCMNSIIEYKGNDKIELSNLIQLRMQQAFDKAHKIRQTYYK